MKTCTKCSLEKDEAGFRKWRTVCRECVAQKCKKKYWENPEADKKKQLKWRLAHPESARESRLRANRKWTAANPTAARERYWRDPEKAREYRRKWRQENLERNRESQRKYQRNNPDRRKNSDLRQQYGITLEDYNRMLLEQKGVCAICGGINLDERRLCVDHNHDTGKVRSLLCDACNVGLGRFKDSADLVQAAADYLKKHS